MSSRSPAVRDLVSSRYGNLRFGSLLGRGGEGEVFEIVGQQDLVAKLYHSRLTSERTAKLKVMQAMTRPDLQQISAWPLDLILANNVPCGFVMPKAKDAKEIHVAYGPKSRKQQFPNAGFAFLVQCAANIARAFAVVHDNRLVIGDVNDRFVMVSRNATVKLIDCDSFQIEAGTKKYLCEVGVGTFTPPELQGQSFRGIVRTANHDNFGLAVLLFHLLFLGRHPFAGRPQDGGDTGIEAAIHNHRFAYSRDTTRTRMLAPPGTVSPRAASSDLAELFERAFGPGGSSGKRPTALDWVKALGDLTSALKECPENRAHAYHRDVGACPWCSLEATTGWELFHYVPPLNAPPSIDVDAIWAAIMGLRFSSVPSLDQFAPKELPPASQQAELVAEANRRQSDASRATASRQRAEELLRNAEEALRQKEHETEAARQHALAFEPDQNALLRLNEKLRAIKREENRQRIWDALVWLQFLGGAFAAIERVPTLAGALIVSSGLTALLARLCRHGLDNDATIQLEIMQLKASLALGPDSRWALHAEAEAEQLKTAEKIPKAQTWLYRAQVAETKAREQVAALGTEVASARQAIEQRQQAAAATRAPVEAKYFELLEQQRQLEAFHQRRKLDLHVALSKLDELATGLKGAIKTLRDQERKAQLSRHLDQFFIANEEITGFGPVLKSTLASFGIETAADITESDVMNVPGFGPGRTQTLLAWRRSKEVSFRFVAGQTDPAKRAALERQNMSERRKYERQLRLGLQDLEAKAESFKAAIETYKEAAQAIALETAIADREVAVASGQIRGRPW